MKTVEVEACMGAWVDKLRDSTGIILVEGKKDVAALAMLGIHNVHVVKGRPHYQTVEFIADQYVDCIILVDLDKEGKKLFAYFRRALSERGVRIDNRFRLFLFRYTPLRQIEGLPHYIQTLEN